MSLLFLSFLVEPAFLVYLKLLVFFLLFFPQLVLQALMVGLNHLVSLMPLVVLGFLVVQVVPLLVSPLQVIPMSLLFLSFLAEPAFLVSLEFFVFLLFVFPQLDLLALMVELNHLVSLIPLVALAFLVVQVDPLFLRLLVFQVLTAELSHLVSLMPLVVLVSLVSLELMASLLLSLLL